MIDKPVQGRIVTQSSAFWVELFVEHFHSW